MGASLLEQPESFQHALISWFAKVAQDYPWRRTTDPYEILVSEVMLQQTTVQSVIENRRFERFLEEFPTVHELAVASEEQILRAWEGLGYYNRVRNLQKTAKAVIDEYEGEFPSDLQLLQQLPGVGAYTSAAVASFAFGLSAPLVDANVSRVFARVFDDETPINTPAGQKLAWSRAEVLVPADQARSYNAGLMELGQQVCKNKEVLCDQCPVQSYCQTTRPLELPKKKAKAKSEEVTEHALWLRRGERVLLQQGQGSRRKGMWTLPLIPTDVGLPLVSQTKYAITKYKVTLRVYSGDEIPAEGRWVSLSELEQLPIPSPIRKVIESLLQQFI